jgi:hypothetical protein
MTRLFESGELGDFLQGQLKAAADRLESISEDEVLSRSVDDLTLELAAAATITPLVVGTEPIDGSVAETTVDVSRDFIWNGSRARGFEVKAVYEFTGDKRVFQYRPSQNFMVRHEATIGNGTITVGAVRPGLDTDADQMRAALAPGIDRIRQMAGFAATDVGTHNASVPGVVRRLVEQRKDRVQKRCDLAGALGFPLQRRDDALRPVPLVRTTIAVSRPHTDRRQPYQDEPAITFAQYEDAIQVVRSTLVAMERTPSVASGKDEEELRDQILVQLNGTFRGAATGETFVQNGKTDILVRVDDRHVFVGECKWWTGQKACGQAVDQLLSYLPWRDEKAALILFIDRKDASAVIEKAAESVRAHAAYKRSGITSSEPAGRQSFVLGHPDDAEREIQLALLFAVLPRGS